jgi:crotonobetainyl-CoA:carnitine CoA-transferase CaiB-like acyl-CoA transferase
VVENFRPGALEKWGLGYTDLLKLRPDLIMTRISGFGQTGPFKNRPGYGVIGEAVSGLREMIGDPDRPPSRVGLPLTDYITAVYAAFGTIMAILVREKTGRGQFVDATLYESAFSFLEASVPTYDKTGQIATRAGTRLPGSAPNNLYPTRDGRHIQITALADQVYRRLAAVMDRPELGTDARFAQMSNRVKNQDELDEIVATWTSRHDLFDLEQRLNEVDVPASRIFNMQDIFEHPLFEQRNMLLQIPDDDLGSIKQPGVVPKLSGTPGCVRWSGHRNGQDTRAVLHEYLAMTDADIDALLHDEVVKVG